MIGNTIDTTAHATYRPSQKVTVADYQGAILT